MRKPTHEELLDSEEFEYAPVTVPVFRRKSDGNLYFLTDTGFVLDRYVRVVDSGGIPVVSRRRGFGENLGGKILKLGVAVLTGGPGLPVAIAKELLDLSKRDFEDARAVKAAVELARGGDPRAAVLRLADQFGPRATYELLARFSDDPRRLLFEKLIERIEDELDGMDDD